MRKQKHAVNLFVFLPLLVLLYTSVSDASVLAFPEREQEQWYWCWAACSQATLAYYGTSINQCEVADWAREAYNWGDDDCCENPGENICNQPNNICTGDGSILNILGNWGITCESCDYRALSLAEITCEIDNGRPFIMRLEYDLGGHFVVGHGIEDDIVHYMDPGNGYQAANYNWLVNNLGWNITLRIIRPALDKVVLTGDTAPDGSTIEKVSGRVYGMTKGFDVNDLGTVAYHATLEGDGEGIFTSTGNIIALTGEPAPGGGSFKTFYQTGGYNHVSINNRDKVAYMGVLDDDTEGVFTKTTVIAKEGQASPDGGTYERFDGSDINDSGLVVFIADTPQRNIYSPTSVLLTGDEAPGGGALMWLAGSIVLRQDGTVVYLGSFVDDALSGQGVFSSDGTNFGRAGDIAPGGGTFATSGMKFNCPDANNVGEAAFLAELDTGEDGIFRSDIFDKSRIANEGGPAPGGGTFIDLFGSPSINDSSLVVYAGLLSDLRTGIFDSNNNIIALEDELAFDNFVLIGLCDPVLTNTGQVAFWGRVSDGVTIKEGIFITRMPPNTPTGTNVEVDAGSGIIVTFSEVTETGNTTAAETTCSAAAPSGFTILPLADSTCYDVQTTATYSGTVEVCITYDDTGVSDEPNLKLLVYEDPPGEWSDITTNVDTVNNIICGETDSLSQFAVMLQENILHVGPSGYPYTSIQATIDDASDGYTVLVHDGTYVENINFNGKAITIVSENGAESTIIDGNADGRIKWDYLCRSLF